MCGRADNFQNIRVVSAVLEVIKAIFTSRRYAV